MGSSMLGFDARDARSALNLLSITVRDRYMGSRLGSLWAILNPLLMMIVFIFLFGFLFKTRVPGADTTGAYASWMIAGYGPWIATTEALGAAAVSVLGAASLVKNIAFKTELLPIAAVFSSAVTLSVALSVLLVLVLAGGGLTWHALLVVPVVLVHYLLLTGLGLALATIAVFFRDIVQVLPNVLMMILLTSPILYPMQSMPRPLQVVGLLNPFFIVSSAYRAALLEHRIPDLGALSIVAGASLVLVLFALRLFRRAKGHFEAYL